MRVLRILIVSSLFFVAAIWYFSRFRADLDPTAGGGDAKTYYFLARQLIEKHMYTEAWPEPPFRAWRPPLYPAFVALWLWMGGNNLQLVVLVQYVLLLASGVFVWYLSWLVFDSFYRGLVAAGLFLFYPPLYFYASYLYSEPLFIFLLLLFLIIGYKAAVTGKIRWFALSGFVLGLSILVRTVNLPVLMVGSTFMVLIILLRVYKKKDSWLLAENRLSWRLPGELHSFLQPIEKTALISTRNIFVFLVCSWFLIGAWTIRNYLTLNNFVLINTANNMNIYLGTRTDLYRDEADWHDKSWQVSPQKWIDVHEEIINPLRADFGEVGSSQKLFEITLSYIKQNPLSYTAHKVHTLYHYLIPNLYFSRYPEGNSPIVNSGRVVIYLSFFIGIASIILTHNDRGMILLAFFLGLVISSSLSFYSERFVIVTMPLYLIFAVNGLFFAVGWGWQISKSKYLLD